MAGIKISDLPPNSLPLVGDEQMELENANGDSTRTTVADIASSASGLDATFITVSANAALPNERVLTEGTNISFVDTGPNGTLTINATAAGVSFPLLAPDGSAAAPSYSWSTESGTGIHLIAANLMGFSIVGTTNWEMGGLFQAANNAGPAMSNTAVSGTIPGLLPAQQDPNTGIGSNTLDQLSLIAGGAEIARATAAFNANQFAIIQSGSSSVPELTSLADPDTGFRWPANNETVWMGGGSRAWNFSTLKFYSQFSNGGAIFNRVSQNDVPTLVPDHADDNTGIGSAGGDELSLIAGGVEGIRVAETAGNVFITYFGPILVPFGSGTQPGGAFDGDDDTGYFRPVDDAFGITAGGVESVRYAELSSRIIQTNANHVGLTASVTQTQAGGLPLLSSYNEIATVGTTGDALTAFDVAEGTRLIVVNNGANSLQLFPAVGDDIGAGVDTAITIAAGDVGIFIGRDSVNWDALLNAGGGGGVPAVTDEQTLVGVGAVLTASNFFKHDNADIITLTGGFGDTFTFDMSDGQTMVLGGSGIDAIDFSDRSLVQGSIGNAAVYSQSYVGTLQSLSTNTAAHTLRLGITGTPWDAIEIFQGAKLRFLEVGGLNPVDVVNSGTHLQFDLTDGGISGFQLDGNAVFKMQEIAAAPADTADYGQFWVRNDVPNVPMFTDDTGTDFVLNAGGGDVFKVGTPVDNQVGVWTGDGTIEGTTGLTYDGADLDITGNITLTGTVDGIDIATDVAANTAKVTNANHSGDATGATVLTIADDAVTYAKMQNVVADDVLLGNDAGAGGIVAELTGAQVNLILPNFTDVLDGLTPLSGGGTTNFLRADGTWVAPAGGGDVTKVGTPVDNQVGVWTGDGTIEGTAGLTYDGSDLDVTGNITLDGTVDGIDIAVDVPANTAKVTNATHTGQVTGATALALDITAITAQPAAGALIGADTFIVNDGGTLSEITADQMATFFSAGGGLDNDVVQARRTTGLLLTTAFVDVTLDTTDVESDAAVLDHDLVTNTDNIIIGATGTYKIGYEVDIEVDTTGEGTITADGRVRLNDGGVGLPGSEALCGVFSDGSIIADFMQNHLSQTFYAELTSGDFITLQLEKVELGGADDFTATRVLFTAERCL